MKQHPRLQKQNQLAAALRKELDALEGELAYHKDLLERFQQSPAWRWTAPVRRVANLFRSLPLSSSRRDTSPRKRVGEVESSAATGPQDYFTGMCQISFDNFLTSGATLEFPRSDNPEISKLLKDLAAKEREIEQQKWLFERFLESPAWRWTEPIRWVATELLGLNNGHYEFGSNIREKRLNTIQVKDEDSVAISEIKTYFTELCYGSLENLLSSETLLELPQSEKPTLSIILVLFNRAELTLACLRSIVAHCGVDCEIVIIDNDSKDKTPQLLDRLRGARIVRNPTNRHFLAAVNQAARECRGEYLLLLNNDAQLLPGAVQSALVTVRSSLNIGAVGGRIVLLDGTLQEAGSIVWKDGSCAGYGRGDEPFAPMYSFRRDVDYCSGAFLLTSRKVWEELGGFDHAFEPAYYEETDYCMRLWERGKRVVYEPDATIIHYEFGSSQSTSSAISLQKRNQEVFFQRHRGALEHRESAGREQIIRARSTSAGRRILFIDDRVPHPWLGSGFPRAHALHRVLQDMGCFVTLYPIDVIHEPWGQAYSDFPREVEIMMGMGRPLLESFLESRKDYYSTMIVSRPHNMKIVAAIRSAHPDWFEHADVLYDAEALFSDREVALRKLVGNSMSEEEIRTAVESEVRLAAAADRVIAVSENDRAAFLNHGIRRVEVLGHSIETSPGDTPFDSREGLLFVGAVHEELSPNGDSLIWFLSEIYPRIRRKLGDLPVTIAGVNRSKRIRDMALPPVCITGYLPSLTPLYLKSRVFVAPTRYAAGIPHKVHEAAASGLPVVATPLLARQLGWNECELGIAEDSESFAEMCIQIYTDESRWSTLRDAALERVRRECSPTRFERTVDQIVSGKGS